MSPEIQVNGRQTGRTTKQILDAPKGCVMICAHSRQAAYNRHLALRLGRPDIIVKTAGEVLARGPSRLLNGRATPNVIVDHAVSEILPGTGMYGDLVYMLAMYEKRGYITRYASDEDAGKWRAKVGSSRVNHNGTGFWAVYQNEVAK